MFTHYLMIQCIQLQYYFIRKFIHPGFHGPCGMHLSKYYDSCLSKLLEFTEKTVM